MEYIVKQIALHFTKSAIDQLTLIKENDYTLDDNYHLRLQISGKGCDGFTYAIGFTKSDPADLKFISPEGISFIMDPFVAFYLKQGEVNYLFDPIQNVDGFMITNFNESAFKGKFWKSDTTKIPPQ